MTPHIQFSSLPRTAAEARRFVDQQNAASRERRAREEQEHRGRMRALTPAARAGVRNELAPAERSTLEAVRDRLVNALKNLDTALGGGGSPTPAAMYARANYHHMQNTIDGEERKAIEGARNDVTAALVDVNKILGDTDAAARLTAAQTRINREMAYARLNAGGGVYR